MHDIRWIRDNPEAFDAALARRGLAPESASLIALDARRREAQTEAQTLQSERNALSKDIGRAKAEGRDVADVIARVGAMKDRLGELEAEQKGAEDALTAALEVIPNLPFEDVPVGADEAANVELRRVGDRPAFDFEPKQHFDLGETLGEMDFDTAASLSGARFVLLSGRLARMERALAQFMLDTHTGEFGYTEISPPVLVRDHVLYGTGQLPKFAEDQYRTEEGMWLIPTAEVPLTNLAAGQVVEENSLPRRYTAYTLCFRSEAGAAGRDTRGMLRQHQFSKVEMVSIAHPDGSEAELERMTGCAEEILKRLDIPYRVVVLSTGDMGFGARKTYDLEVWLPGQGAYREISSCSNCGDFQARRMNARFRPAGGKGTRFVHTLNGSGLAVGRTLIAVMENCQQADGSIAVPEALRPYMGGIDRIAA
ncbi:MAG: serine--tRNA ligase [Rhodospirillaceae bacterium]|nr:serine--tRNA ligase [Rhodospirillaceae bacterium]MYF85329.1 serine--tRNA ligase [Rhodospirillaceae bacterium]MYH37686.1 serine--tRNA ligase [Rhodospirillaceae bacterium]MYK14289.1 serine--tRNA ligase [Rhodospirillaceae bacterium]MYK58889.1 serine--tRNA ligase [Rhodospirillaceae bacterium]